MIISAILNRIFCDNITEKPTAQRPQNRKMNNLRVKILLHKLKAGKTEYFDEFYRLTKGAVWYVVRKYVYDRFDAEDVMQDAYVSFLTNLGAVSGNPVPYLCTVAKNKALDKIKKDSKIDKSSPFEELRLGAEDNYSDGTLIEECRKKLDEEEFFIIEQTIIIGYNRVEVAKMLNKPVSTVNRKYNQILKKIKIIAKGVYDERT